jgi:hypothetical protein
MSQASKRPNYKTSQLQNIPASKQTKLQNIPSFKTSQASKCPKYKVPQPQNVPTSKRPKPQNIPSLKTSQASKGPRYKISQASKRSQIPGLGDIFFNEKIQQCTLVVIHVFISWYVARFSHWLGYQYHYIACQWQTSSYNTQTMIAVRCQWREAD